jgi:signal transduction histidine kinase
MISGRIGRRLRQWLGAKSLRHKLGVITILAVTCAALAASAALLAFRIFEQRSDHAADTLALNQVVAENAIGAVSFQDATSAESLLATLRAKPSIRGAVIDTPTKRNFATYGSAPPPQDRLTDGRTAAFDGWLLHTSAVIGTPQSSLGTVHLVSDLRPMLRDAMVASLVALGLALTLALLLSLFVLARLRGVILNPVENLHAVTRRVTENADFSERADVISSDEVGELTLAFNRMLDRLQAKESDLRAANTELTGEIEERKRLETKLVEASRYAGMAEIATGVLHNVGNVLNSVNVSAILIVEQVRASKTTSLAKAVQLMVKHQANLGDFLTHDASGKQLPRFIEAVSEQLTREQIVLTREAQDLQSNVEHIKQIVAMQQNYAKVSGAVESLPLPELIEDAMRMSAGALARHRVDVVREFAETPLVLVDRHKVLQILVNLISNAKQALDSRLDDRRLLLRVAPRGTNRVVVEVSDNGIGISPENLTRIFNHGFTTKKTGHGFGLHSCANAAKELGGSLSVRSAGPDTGATFTLCLPVAFDKAITTTKAPFQQQDQAA